MVKQKLSLLIASLQRNIRYAWVVALLVLTCVLAFISVTNRSALKGKEPLNLQKQNSEETIPESYEDTSRQGFRAPQIYLYGQNDEGQSQSSGGFIAQAATDEPALYIGGYMMQGEAELSVYEANEETLFSFLLHDKDGNQIKKKVDSSKLKFITTIHHSLLSKENEQVKIVMPFAKTGLWYVRVKQGKSVAEAVVLRSNLGVYAEEGDNELIFWGQNFTTKRSIADGTVHLYNLEGSKQEIRSGGFTNEGTARVQIDATADIAYVEQGQDRAVVPLNLKYLNYSYANYKSFLPKRQYTKYFIFTDRPLYKPGDTVNFKAVLRNDDDARYTVGSGQAKVQIYDQPIYGDTELRPVLDVTLPISSVGTINGSYKLPEGAKVGQYYLSIKVDGQSEPAAFYDSEWSSDSTYFNVEHYKKPEFSLDITTPQQEFIAGDKLRFTVHGTYFSGQGMSNQKVQYRVYSGDFYEYDYLDDQKRNGPVVSDSYAYGSYYGNSIAEGNAVLNKDGTVTIDVDTKTGKNNGKSQIFTIETSLEDGSMTPSFAKRNVLIYSGLYGIYRKDYVYASKIGEVHSMPLTILPTQKDVSVANVTLKAAITRTNWVAVDNHNKYTDYRKEEEKLTARDVKTDSSGNAVLSFTPQKVGSYDIQVSGKDSRGNTISKVFYLYVTKEGEPYYTDNGVSMLTVTPDKSAYLPTDTARFTIHSVIPNRDVLLSLERGRVDRYKVAHLNGNIATVDIPLTGTDMPNMYAKVTSFSDFALDENTVNVPVSPASKKLKVQIRSDAKKYGAGETVTVDVTTTDDRGNPVPAELALWTVDKAIFELSDNKLGDIFDTFWKERFSSTSEANSLEGISMLSAEGGGGCFAAGTRILMADGTMKRIEDVLKGDKIKTRTEKSDQLVTATVRGTHTATVDGYIILNGGLKVTPNHIMYVNGTWKEAGSIQPGDVLVNSSGVSVPVTTIEWQRGAYTVYNLEVEKYHTFFAAGIWVHNEKGLERSAFKDTAYWNPSLVTDANGKARVRFTLPDNLTTWTIAAVGATESTQVGQTTTEILVSKDVIVRPILPNILHVGDKAVLSALVQNFTGEDQNFDISLTFDSGTVDKAVRKSVKIKSGEKQQIFWSVQAKKENPKSKLVISARSVKNPKLGDVLTQEIPVRPFGFTQTNGAVGEGNKTYPVKLAADTDRRKTSVSLSLSPTLLGTLPTAMKYLVDYPYGCVEQTTSRFVPAVIAALHPQQFSEALAGKNPAELMKKGIMRLQEQQQGDGGWTWWFTGNSSPYITSYVVEYLLEAKRVGAAVDDDVLLRAKRYLESNTGPVFNDNGSLEPSDEITPTPTVTANQDVVKLETEIARKYGLTLLGSKQALLSVDGRKNISDDYLAFLVMTNYRNGFTDPQKNGLSLLLSRAQAQGDTLFWERGDSRNFGSLDASTALAIRAVLMAGGSREVASKAVRYLSRNRHDVYWSNTYATSQVIRALADFSQTGSELTPNFTYRVSLDGKQIAQGNVTQVNQAMKDVTIPLSSLKPDSRVSVQKSGEGQLYSSLLISQYRTDRNAKSEEHGLTISKSIENSKGKDYPLAVGEIAIIRITLGGLKAAEQYGVIEDTLPSGLVPINPALTNETYFTQGQPEWWYYAPDTQTTENGIIMSLYELKPGNQQYTYKARVVSEGEFIVPPATASLMYTPTIYARTAVGKLAVLNQSEAEPLRNTGSSKTALQQFQVILGMVKMALIGLIVLGIIAFVIFEKIKANKNQAQQEHEKP